jgi:hypothetical protein
MSTQLAPADDVVFVDERRDSRVIVNIPAQFSLSDRRNRRGERRVFRCRAVYLSARAVGFVSHVKVKVGERVIAHVDRLGKIEGTIGCLLEGGFVMNISASANESDKLVDRIEWLEKHKNHDIIDRRADERSAPIELYSRVTFPNGGTETCLVLNVSASGIALSVDTIPEVGTVLVIGKIVSHVVRQFDGGFAAQFINRQDVAKGSRG